MIRIGLKSYIITENYTIPIERGEKLFLFSLGGRSIVRNIGIDYSLWIPRFCEEENLFVAAPFLGVTIPIGNKYRVSLK